MSDHGLSKLAARGAIVGWGVLILLAGCSQPPKIGGACTTTVDGVPGSVLTISSPALECEGRVCLQVGTAGALCTSECASDDDCTNLASDSGQRCQRGFVCRQVSSVGEQACRHLCMCRDNLPGEPICGGVP